MTSCKKFQIPNSEGLNLEQLEQAHDKLYQELVEAGYYITLEWHDPEKKDFLMVVKFDNAFEVNNATAKGVTPYDLISLYGDPEMVRTAFPEKSNALYGDCSGAPEFFNEDSLVDLAVMLNKKYKDAIDKRTADEEKKKAEQEKQATLDRLVAEKTASVTNEGQNEVEKGKDQ